MINIGIIEDNYFQLNSYREFLEDFQDCRVVFACRSMAAFREQPVPDQEVHVILLDVTLPGETGIQCIYPLRRLFPEARIIMLSAHDDKEHIIASIKEGAHGYLLKTGRLAEIYQGMMDAVNFGSTLSPRVAYQLIRHMSEDPLQQLRSRLTEREYELLHLLKEGHSYKAMADRLHLSVFTINHHLKKIYQKLNVSSKSELVSRLCLNNLQLPL